VDKFVYLEILDLSKAFNNVQDSVKDKKVIKLLDLSKAFDNVHNNVFEY